MAEDEVLIEVEAVQAVYGDDCLVLDKYPPHLHVHIKPRTADVSSQQFVEAVLGIKAGPQYPREPPHIDIIESKGLDEQRQKHLINGICDKACELSSCLMLVALCEEAVERLSSMNHPDGNCPLCLYPLLGEDASNNLLPFMKLMSCFHCFHCECIIRWWNWLQTQKEADPTNSSGATMHPSKDMGNQQGMRGTIEESMGNCPVCRKVFHAKDIEHVLDLVGIHSQLSFSGTEVDDDDEKLLQSDSESIRRQKFEAILKLQEENSALIEPKKNEVLLPGMFLPRSTPTTVSDKDTTTVQEHRDPTVNPETNSSGSSNRPSTSEHRNSGMRKHRVRNSRKQVKQWIKKDNGTAN
uniref:E3 ubiquitin-protein ligase RNF25 n=1 Tax=Davidia involucrata TaxID=16924 RepID=A0A5B7BXB6_DAVIN